MSFTILSYCNNNGTDVDPPDALGALIILTHQLVTVGELLSNFNQGEDGCWKAQSREGGEWCIIGGRREELAKGGMGSRAAWRDYISEQGCSSGYYISFLLHVTSYKSDARTLLINQYTVHISTL